MSSKFGKSRNLPGYDKFKTGLTYRDVYNMLRYSDRHKRRNSVLGFWHEIKLQLYQQAIDCGFDPEANDENGKTPTSDARDES